MTLRQFVIFGEVGTREEREAFEETMVAASADAAEHLNIDVVPWVMRDDLDYEWTCLVFNNAKRLGCF